MQPALSTDLSTNLLFDKVAANLQRLYGYTPSQSEVLARKCYRLFQDEPFCKSVGFGVQDEEFFHHEGAAYMAMRAHYFLTLKLDKDSFIEWVADYMRFIGDAEARRVFIGSLNTY